MRSLRRMLDTQEFVLGLMVQQVTSPWIAKVYADAGADFLYVEYEHMFFNEGSLGDLVLGSRLCGLPVVAKSSYLDRGSICKLLDAGVTGVQLPMTESAGQVKSLVDFAKFPPVGVRAASPGVGNTSYEPVDCAKWLKQANRDTVVIAHVETRTGLEHIDEILAVPGVDVMFVGCFDLSVSLGYPAKLDHPVVVKAIDQLVDAARNHRKVAGMWMPSFQAARPWTKKGVRFFELSGEIGFIAAGAADLIRQFPGHQPRLKGADKHV